MPAAGVGGTAVGQRPAGRDVASSPRAPRAAGAGAADAATEHSSTFVFLGSFGSPGFVAARVVLVQVDEVLARG